MTALKSDVHDPVMVRWLTGVGGSLIALALLVMLGRFTGWKALVTIIPGAAPMAFLTAVGFLLSGVGFLAHGAGRTRAGQIAGALALLLGAGTLVLYAMAQAMEWQAFYYDPRNPILSQGIGFDGRMSPNAAGSFAVLGLALMAMGAQVRRGWLICLCGAILIGVSLLALCGYALGLRAALSWWRYTGMALHTAAGILVAGVVLTMCGLRHALTPEKGTARTLPFFTMAGAAIVVLGIVMFVANDHRRLGHAQVIRSLEVRAGVERFIAAMARMDTATRNHTLTGEERFVERVQAHRAAVRAAMDELARIEPDDAAIQAQVRAMLTGAMQRFALSDAQIRARRDEGIAAAARIIAEESPEVMRDLRAATDGIVAEEERRLARLQATAAADERRLQGVLAGGLLLAAGLITAAFVLVRRTQARLEQMNSTLEERVHARTAALEASNAQLHASARRLRFLADTMPQLVWTARAAGPAESFNAGWVAYTGLTEETSRTDGWTEVLHPEDIEGCFREWNDMLRAGRTGGGEYRLRRASDRAWRWHLWRAQPERDEAGAIVRWVGTSTDIHENKLLEQRLEERVNERTTALRASEERTRLFAEHAPAAVAMFDREMRYVVHSAKWLKDYGLEGREILGRSHYEVFPEIGEEWKAIHRRCLAGATEVNDSDPFDRADGRRQWLSWRVQPWTNGAGEIGGIVMFTEDITVRKNLEENLARARDQALEASRLKSEFLATMSHEIRTPMNAVIGMAELLADTPLSGKQEEIVRTMAGGAEHLLAIVNDILDFSRIESGRIRLDLANFDLRRLVGETVALLVARAQEKGLALTSDLASAPDSLLLGDGGRVRQVLTNLVGNAIKFTAAGAISVTVRTVTETAARVRVRVEVRDTGIGIAPEVRPRLFQPFTQGDGSTTRRFGGTGLGLAISRQLVEWMGGAIGCESPGTGLTAGEPGKGTLFWFELEFARGGPAPAASEAPALAPGVTAIRGGSGRRLLLAEDNVGNQRVAALLLEKMGYTVEVAADGQLALDQLGAQSFDALLVDCQMPVLDGYETTRRIRAGAVAGVDPRLPILALTAYARREDRARCLDAGMDDYVTKPIRVAELQAALDRCGLWHRGARTEAPTDFRPVAPQIESVFDERVLESARDLLGAEAETLIHEMVALYLSDEPDRLHRLDRLAADRQGALLGDEVHSLGGNAAVFGGMQVRRVALDLESAARASAWQTMPAHLAELRAACVRLRAELARRNFAAP